MAKSEFLLLLVFSVLIAAEQVNSFCTTQNLNGELPRHGHPRTERPGTSLWADYEDESEWYAPQPSHKDSQPARKLPKGAIADVRELQSHVDMMEFLHEDDRLCVIKFYASWCKSCQKFGMHYEKMGREKADWIDAKSGQLVKRNVIRMASIEYSKNQALCKSLNVEKLPTVFLYSSGRKLAEVSVGASKFNQVREAVAQYSSLSVHDRDFAAQMEEGHKLIQANVLDPEAAASAEEGTTEKARSEERRAKIEALLSTSTAKRTTRKKWWTHQTK